MVILHTDMGAKNHKIRLNMSKKLKKSVWSLVVEIR